MSNRWSFSRFNAGEGCLRRYHEKYEVPVAERLPELYEPLREIGKGVHRCAEIYKEHLASIGAEQDLSMISLIVEEYFGVDPEVVSTQHYADVLYVFGAFAKRYRHNATAYIGGEMLMMRALPESDISVEGYPDHIEEMQDEHGSITVADDMKAGFSATLTPENMLQGEIEAWRMLEMFPDRRVGWRVSWPRAGTESAIREFKPNYSGALEARLRAIARRIENARVADRWPAQPGSACAYCPLAAICRERTVLAQNSIIITDQESAQQAAADLVLLNAAYDQRREQVKTWTSTHGPINVGDLEAGFTSKTSGDRIGDIGSMLHRLGVEAMIADGTFDGPDDPDISVLSSLVIARGVEVAIKEKLIAINGNATKTKGVRDDARFAGMWIPGETKTTFDLHKTDRKENPR